MLMGMAFHSVIMTIRWIMAMATSSRIHSTNGVYLNIQYSSKGQISEVFTSDGRRVQYDYSDYGDLVQVTLPDRSVVKYFYGLETDSSGKDRSTHLLSRVERPLGRILENEYDSSRRVIKQRSSVGSGGSMVGIASYAYTHTQQTGEGISGYTLISASNGGITRYDLYRWATDDYSRCGK